MIEQVWMVMRTNSAGNVQADSVHSSEHGAEKASVQGKYKDQHVWVDGPYKVET